VKPPSISFQSGWHEVLELDNLIVETLKKAEEGGGLILRAWEVSGQRGEVSLTFANKLKKVVECDLMEREIEIIDSSEQGFSFFVRPYEIKTFRV